MNVGVSQASQQICQFERNQRDDDHARSGRGRTATPCLSHGFDPAVRIESIASRQVIPLIGSEAHSTPVFSCDRRGIQLQSPCDGAITLPLPVTLTRVVRHFGTHCPSALRFVEPTPTQLGDCDDVSHFDPALAASGHLPCDLRRSGTRAGVPRHGHRPRHRSGGPGDAGRHRHGTNTQTNEVATAVTNTEGVYSLPFLKPGVYKVNAELAGLQQATNRTRSSSRSARPARSTSSSQVGAVTEVVTVVSEAGRGLEGRPRHGHRQRARHRAAAQRAQPVHAVVPVAGHHLQRPGDLSAPLRQRRHRRLVDQRRPEPQQRVPARRRAEQLHPGRQQHRLRAAGRLGAGVQDRHQQLRRAVRTHGGRRHQRLAQVGHQRFHGTAYEFARRKAFDSNEYLFKVNNREKPDHKLDQYGFQVDGPVRIPGLFDGREQDLLHVQLRGLQGGDAEPGDLHGARRGAAARRLQQPARRAGAADHDLRPGHRPARERPVGARSRSPATSFPQNRISPMAQRVHAVFPARRTRRRPPATPGATTSSSRRTSPTTRSTTSPRKSIRTSATSSKVFVRYAYNKRTEERYTNGITTGPAQDGQLPLERAQPHRRRRLGAHDRAPRSSSTSAPA